MSSRMRVGAGGLLPEWVALVVGLGTAAVGSESGHAVGLRAGAGGER